MTTLFQGTELIERCKRLFCTPKEPHINGMIEIKVLFLVAIQSFPFLTLNNSIYFGFFSF